MHNQRAQCSYLELCIVVCHPCPTSLKRVSQRVTRQKLESILNILYSELGRSQQTAVTLHGLQQSEHSLCCTSNADKPM